MESHAHISRVNQIEHDHGTGHPQRGDVVQGNIHEDGHAVSKAHGQQNHKEWRVRQAVCNNVVEGYNNLFE